MSENENNVPKRRFKEFNNAEAWEQCKLSELCIKFTDGDWIEAKDQSNEGVRLIQTGNVGVTRYLDKSSNQKWISEDTFERLHCEEIFPGDILISRLPEPAGRACIMPDLGKKMITAVDCTIVRTKPEVSNKYLVQYLSTDDYFNEVNTCLAGGTRQRISRSKLSEFIIPMPKDDKEQKQIGHLFESIDKLITLHQHKLEKIKALKKAYLTDMFPAEGEGKPKLRFAGFTDDWKQRELGELSVLITKGTTPLDKSGIGNINFIKIENIDSISGEIIPISKITIEEHEGYLKRSQLQENDILFSIAGTLGRVTAVNKGILPANTNQALAIIRLNTGYLDYIMTYLKGKAVSEYIKKNPTVGAQPNLSLEQVSNLIVSLPKIEEQKVIGTFFSNLDNLITLHQRKIEKLQDIKKAYLNEMFI